MADSVLDDVLPDDFEPSNRQQCLGLVVDVLRRLRPLTSEADHEVLELVVGIASRLHDDECSSLLSLASIPRELPDHFPEIERRGIVKLLELNFTVSPGMGVFPGDLYGVGGDIPNVECGSAGGGWAHLRPAKPGETRYESLRLALHEFLIHEADHSLWKDGEPLFDAHADDPVHDD